MNNVVYIDESGHLCISKEGLKDFWSLSQDWLPVEEREEFDQEKAIQILYEEIADNCFKVVEPKDMIK